MKLPNVTGLMKIGKTFMAANRPEILFGASVTATVASVVLAAKGGYEAGQKVMIEENPSVDFTNPEKPLEVKDKARLTWLCYMPAAVTTVGALGSTTGLHLVHKMEKKALATTALAAIEEVKAQAQQYGDDIAKSVQEHVDLTDEQKEKIQNSLNEKNADRNGGVGFVQNSDGTIEELYLVRDAKTGRDIWSNERRIEDAALHVNNFISKHGDCDLNSFYSNAGFETTPDGDDWGWSGEFVELKWDTTVRDDGRPVRRFAFRTSPKAGYNRCIA